MGARRRKSSFLSRSLSRAEARLHSSYAEGGRAIFNRRRKRLGVETGDRRTAAGIDRKRSTVSLQDSRGRHRTLRPESRTAVIHEFRRYRSIRDDQPMRAGRHR